MGRKINYADKPKKGPGRKARKQTDPVFSNLKNGSAEGIKYSRKQKIRARKRELLKQKKQDSKVVNRIQLEKTCENKEDANPSTTSTRTTFDLQKSKAKYAKIMKKTGVKGDKSLLVKNCENNEHTSPLDIPITTKNHSQEYKDKYAYAIGKGKTIKGNGNVTHNTSKKIISKDILASSEESDDAQEEEYFPQTTHLKEYIESEGSQNSSEGDISGESDPENDSDSLLPIERAGKKLKQKKEENERLAQAEMKELVSNREQFQFPDSDDPPPSNLQEIHMRIKDIIGVLADFSVNRDPMRSRAEYMDLLSKDLCTYYSYNEFLMQILLKLFSSNELLEFLEASEVQRPLTIRTNSLKTRRRDLAQSLINRGINLDPVGKWSKEGLVVYSSQVPLGATPEYLAGQYIIQGASSMLPVIALAPEENERILDLCAAPGGKSSHIAALMKNTGVLFANDVSKERLHAVVGNFHRLGIQNAIVTNIDGTKYREVMTGFDRVLLDAPCTGSGVISKDPSVKTTKTEIDVQRCYNLQRKLLLTAIDCTSANSKTGGFIVYSTCSVLPQENEWVIDYALSKRNVRLVPCGIDFGTEGLTSFEGRKYHPSIKLTRRFYPHTYNMDGFFCGKAAEIL